MGITTAPRLLVSALLITSFTACSNSEDDPKPGICLNIEGTVEAGGLQIRKPEKEVNGCKEIPGPDEDTKHCQEKEPDLTCISTTEPLGTSINVTFTGCVSAFGLEAQSDDLVVTALKEQVNNINTDPGYDVAGTAGSRAENTPAAVVSVTRSTTAPKTECSDLGAFSLDNVPTETPLIIRVTDQHLGNDIRQYVDTYQYNIILRNGLIRKGPDPDAELVATSTPAVDPTTYCASNDCYVVDDVTTVVSTTFSTIALTAGVTGLDTGGEELYDGTGPGHIAGEVQDCTSEDTIRNAVIGLSADIRKLAYFDVDYRTEVVNLEDPNVDQTRTRTNGDGLYAAIAVQSQDGGQPVEIGAVVTESICGQDGVCMCVDGKKNPSYTGPEGGDAELLVLGYRTIYVFPDSITILTFDRQLYTAP